MYIKLDASHSLKNLSPPCVCVGGGDEHSMCPLFLFIAWVQQQ